MKKLKSNNILSFKKASILELNESAMKTINGGSTILGGETCTGCCCVTVTISITINDPILKIDF